MNYFPELSHGLIVDDTSNMYPSCLYGYRGGGLSFDAEFNTVMGVVVEGEVKIARKGEPDFTLRAGYYFSNPGPVALSGSGHAAIFERKGYRGLFQVGGPAEDHGDLEKLGDAASSGQRLEGALDISRHRGRPATQQQLSDAG